MLPHSVRALETTMSDDATAITNLLYRYAEFMDLGDFAGAAGLFAHADVKLAGGQVVSGAENMENIWVQYTKRHADGTPMTKHVVTNPIVEFSDDRMRATSRSYYTVLQATESVPLQVIAAGRYHDSFEKVDGRWRFSARDYSLFDLKGDLRDHLYMLS
jgi:3-phenylpropionate/cinnamic acid dioxygenase small subunit